MKKRRAPIIALALFFASCQDETGLEIFLSGENPHEVSLNAEYVDPGATASDDEDGDISSLVTVDGEVNVDLVGDYQLIYEVEDDAGNQAKPVTRTVKVRNDADFLDGIYFVSANFSYGSSTGTPTVGEPNRDDITSSTTVNNRFFLGAFPFYCELNGSAISIPEQGTTANSWSGSGSVDATGNMTISIMHDNSWGAQIQYELLYTNQQ